MHGFRSLYKFTLQKLIGDRRDCKAENSTIVQNAEKAIKIKKRDSAAAEAAVKDNDKSKLRPTSSHIEQYHPHNSLVVCFARFRITNPPFVGGNATNARNWCATTALASSTSRLSWILEAGLVTH